MHYGLRYGVTACAGSHKYLLYINLPRQGHRRICNALRRTLLYKNDVCVQDVSPCKGVEKSPVFVSWPHFMYGDPARRKSSSFVKLSLQNGGVSGRVSSNRWIIQGDSVGRVGLTWIWDVPPSCLAVGSYRSGPPDEGTPQK